ncbi:MAG: bile acid:sodium symporter family protein [Salinisphaeraceae bacterium]|nr:bile acid:sodium symporter family protein [Salinisphaeraceae bacterium]
MNSIDQISLNFDPAALDLLNLILALVMFGVALDLKVADFKRVLRQPKAPLIGLASQFFIMPAFACLILMILQPHPSLALGIILVAACPGGNVSNFFTSLGRGNAALSVSMSAISTMCSIVMTPFNFLFWGGINPQTADLVRNISVSPADILGTVVTILVVPTILGMAVGQWRPGLAARLLKPMRYLSILVMVGFVVLAFAANWQNFLQHIGLAFWIVFIVNGAALLLGFNLGRLTGLQRDDCKAVAFETGIQNTAFGLILIFNFFGGLGGMALIAAWWGVWHLITGLSLSLFWSSQAKRAAQVQAA